MAHNLARPVLRGVCFDMDGTLTVPNLDFAQMYKRCGVSMKDDIILTVNQMPKAEKEASWRVIEEMEAEGKSSISPLAMTSTRWMFRISSTWSLV